ncbi:Hypothetical predicted protein [Paramuricea clavata]|uniref:Uncharacterized protein n=1 Tax=Paramuricea clavata TaxID=317549 RepID=A0A6S7HN00_PARCT|nr:Hypothetical predicted protein [Paramuricea clavata]
MVDSLNVPAITKFSHLQELVEPHIRSAIDCLPFTDEGEYALPSCTQDASMPSSGQQPSSPCPVESEQHPSDGPYIGLPELVSFPHKLYRLLTNCAA